MESAKKETETETLATCRTKKRHVFLFTHPRTASNLLTRLLSQQEGWLQSEYHFRPSFRYATGTLHESKSVQLTSEQRQHYENLFLRGISNLRSEREAAIRQDRHILVKNHAFYLWDPIQLYNDAATSTIFANPTRLDDDFLASWQPVFLIRHPALVFESWYRAEMRVRPIDILDPAWDCFLTFSYSRRLYDWFVSHGAVSEKQENGAEPPNFIRPVVVDADDIIETGSTTTKLCELLKMDPRKVCYAWKSSEPGDNVNLSLRHRSYMSTFWASQSIDKSKSSTGLNLHDKYTQWKQEFGDGVADSLLTYVNNAMIDYNYLRNRKI